MRGILLVFTLLFMASLATAQTVVPDGFWIQVRAIRSEADAISAAEKMASRFPKIAVFKSDAEWYNLAIGPFDRRTAQNNLYRFLDQHIIPNDSFMSDGDSYTQKIWPPQGNTRPDITATFSPITTVEPFVEIPHPPTETFAEARANEARMSHEEKRELQRLLQWAGVYHSHLDGKYGRGTRKAMREWQRLNNVEETGVMTTAQRAKLFSDYNAVFEGLDLQLTHMKDAGIKIEIPLGLVSAPKRDAPFVRYESSTDNGVSLILISQKGDAGRMRALYDVLQTLDIIPVKGERTIKNNSFTITGIDSKRHVSVFATLSNGEIKGAILSWPINDPRRKRVQERIFSSFSTTNGTLPAAHFLDIGETPVDLIAGLTIRQPDYTLTGTYLDNRGHILTADTDLGSCNRIDTLEGIELSSVATQKGAVILKANSPIRPISLPTFQSTPLEVPNKIFIGGFSYGGLLGAPTLTLGQISDDKGLDGNTEIARLKAVTLGGDIGGPVMDTAGSIIGILLAPSRKNSRTLPQNVHFAQKWQSFEPLFKDAGVSLNTTVITQDIHPEDLTQKVGDFTVAIRCWN